LCRVADTNLRKPFVNFGRVRMNFGIGQILNNIGQRGHEIFVHVVTDHFSYYRRGHGWYMYPALLTKNRTNCIIRRLCTKSTTYCDRLFPKTVVFRNNSRQYEKASLQLDAFLNVSIIVIIIYLNESRTTERNTRQKEQDTINNVNAA